jgi:methyl-accepting chemotaxis protein
MKEGLITDENLRQSYLNLKKASEQVKKDYNRLIKEDFGEQEWRKEGKKINNNIRKYEKMLKDVTRNLEKARDSEAASEDNITTVDEGLDKIRDQYEPMVRAMKEKINQFSIDLEMDEREGQGENEQDDGQQEQEQIEVNLMNNQEYLGQRRKELQEIHKTAALIKDTTDKMAQDVHQQGEMLNDIEEKVVKTEDNVEKAGKEINRANELSKGNTKRLCCIIWIVIIAIGVVLAVVLSLIL